jgi:hypothetical protein
MSAFVVGALLVGLGRPGSETLVAPHSAVLFNLSETVRDTFEAEIQALPA